MPLIHQAGHDRARSSSGGHRKGAKTNGGMSLLILAGTVALTQVHGQVWAMDRGELEYRSRCASCHGIDARGGGPAASLLTTAPPDLTQLSKRNGGVFPETAIIETIDGRKRVEAHGSRDMPVWGYRYMYGDDVGRKTRLQALVAYLRRIQEK